MKNVVFRLVPKLQLGHAIPGSSASQVNAYRRVSEAELRGRWVSEPELGNQVKNSLQHLRRNLRCHQFDFRC